MKITDTQVYCTRCENFEVKNDTPYCKFSEECYFWDTEDSRTLKDRPCYEGVE